MISWNDQLMIENRAKLQGCIAGRIFSKLPIGIFMRIH